MPDLLLDLRHLKYARFVAEQGSFHRAANALNLSQSTVSRRIASLERRVGVQLFERSRTGARLTSIGERFLHDAIEEANHLQRAVSDVAFAQRTDFGELRIGLMSSLASGFLAELFSRYRRRFPNVDLRIQEATSRENAAAVLRGRLDAAFIPGDPRLPGCEVKHLWRDQLYVAVPEDHALGSRSNLVWDDVRDETFLVAEEGYGPEAEAILIRELSTQGFYPRISVQGVGRENLINMVGLGFGLTLATRATLGTPYQGVKFIPVVTGGTMVSSSIVWSGTNKNPAFKKLLEMSLALALDTAANS